MSESDEPHPRRRGDRAGAAGVALLLAAAVAVGGVWWADTREPGPPPPDPDRNPAAVEPPPGLDLPEAAPAGPVATPLAGVPLDPVAVRRAIGRLADDRRLGRRVAVVVSGLDGRPVLSRGPDTVTPASTNKLVTSLAALAVLGPEHRFETSAVADGRRVVLVGGGDPLLERRPASPGTYPERADLTTLARQTATALLRAGTTRVRLDYDDTLFTGPAASPRWEPSYLPDDVVSPISALWVDEGRREADLSPRSADPAADAARAFAAQLRRHGVRVAADPRARPAAPEATALATVRSSQLVEIVQRILETSDNEATEVLLRHVAIARGRPGSFVAGAAAARRTVERLGVSLDGAELYDGSGLSRDDVLRPASLLGVLATSLDPERPGLAGVAAGLPVAGFSGSLLARFGPGAEAGLGQVRAKTGTLTGVHGLAGVVVGADGSVMLFAAIADRVPVPQTLFARDRLDRLAAALAACSCGGAA